MSEIRRLIEVKKTIAVEVREYPKDIKNLNPKLKIIIKNFFKKGKQVSFISGFNFQYKKNIDSNEREIWIFSWIERNGEKMSPIIIKEIIREKCKKKN